MKSYLPLAAFVAPLVLFFLLASLLPYEVTVDSIEDARAVEVDGELTELTQVDPDKYLTLVCVRVILMLIAIGIGWRIYTGSFPLAIDRWGVMVGLFGAVLWIGICQLQLESRLLVLIGLPDNWLGERTGVNPFSLYPDAGDRAWFLFLRFTLLVVAVPIAEELFLRGFFMRFADAVAWEDLPLNQIGMHGLAAGTLYGIFSHPSEFVAAALWFSLVSWLMIKTNRFWNCVLAHAITNLVLGLFVLSSGSWHLW